MEKQGEIDRLGMRARPEGTPVMHQRWENLSRSRFKASWEIGSPLRDPDVASLAFFLVERYCSFVVEGGNVYHVRGYHHPWILQEARVSNLCSTMAGAAGLPEPVSEPLIHFSKSLDVEVWAPAHAGATLPRPGLSIPVE